MIDKVIAAVEKYSMLKNGGKVIVALSGGADSVALLHSLISIKEKYNISISAAHLNHLLRGEEADRDERFCKILCENYNIPFYLRRRDIRAISAERKISEELCGRQERYSFFDEIANGQNAVVATAHTASDNAETLLFNLTRGSSLSGAAGIPPVRGKYIRPLIRCTRGEIESYCELNGLEYVTDSTNLSDGYTRNKIRHKVIPALRELNPRLEESMLRFCESAALAADYISRQADGLLQLAKTSGGYSASVLSEADEAVLNGALVQLCGENTDFSVESRHIELLKGIIRRGGAVDLGGYTAVCRQGLLRFSPKKKPGTIDCIPFEGSISFTSGSKTFTASMNDSYTELKDLVFRTRQNGDRFTFSRRGITKPLRKALNEKRIPAERRGSLVLFCRGSEVLWCEELGFSKQGEELVSSSGLIIDDIKTE